MAEEENSIEEADSIPLDENKKDLIRIGTKFYTQKEINRITIVRLKQAGLSHSEITRILNVPKSLVSKWMKYNEMTYKKMGRPPKFNEEHKKFIYEESERKLTIINCL